MKPTVVLLAACALSWLAMIANAQLDDPFGPGIQAAKAAIEVTVEEEKPTEASATDTEEEVAEAPVAAPPMDPQHIRMNLMDGSVISGKLAVKEIEVETKFGKLKIPVESIKSFRPGLDSYPELKQEVESYIEQLGSEDYAERESSRKALAKMGTKVTSELKAHLQDDNAERVRQIKAILEEFATLEDFSDDDDQPEQAWAKLDTVVTTDFTVLGKISPKSFQVASQYGPLNIQLTHIRTAERDSGAKPQVRKSMSVEGQNLAQIGFKNSSIRVERGDKVTVTAEGQIMMTPWGNGTVSTPDGGQNFGIYQDQIFGGALIAKIGDSGKVFKVGSKHSFEADRSGTLQFAIAMQHEYGQGNYQFPGKYDLKIKVDPK